MRVFVTGGTGLIGRELVRQLLARGDRPVVLSRNAERARSDSVFRDVEIVQGDPAVSGDWGAAVDGCEAVINLAGHNLFAARWNEAVRRSIRESRILSTQNLVTAIARSSRRPGVLVQGSAIGYYGPHGDEELTESSPPGDDFLARVCQEWEQAARPVEAQGLRLAIVRTGVVLARGAGALGVMTPIFKLGPGAPIGSGGKSGPATGRQWMSWIHLDDIVGIVLLALDHPEARGPINGTAPHPVRNTDFSRCLSRTLWRPYAPWRLYLPIGPPDFLLRLLLGDVAEIITRGQLVLPTRARALGYSFRFPELSAALADLFGQAARPLQADSPAPADTAAGGRG